MEITQEFLLLIIGFSCRLINSQVISFNCSDDTYAYIRPDNGLKTWNDAQTVCRDSGATLPIVDNPQRQSCFAEALSYFQSIRAGGSSLTDVWLGANSTGGDPKIWKWLDGRVYNGTIPKMTYKNSYAFVIIKKNDRSVTIFPTDGRSQFYYICLYPTTDIAVCKNGSNQTAYIRDGRCFVKYNEKLSWFSARNRCLNNGGDLASFPDISLLNGLIDSTWYGSYWKDSSTSDPFWIGLRSIWWNWSDAVTGLSTDVTFTLWNNYQPDKEYYSSCITTVSTDYSRWQDTSCTYPHRSYICQVKIVTTRKSYSSITSTSFSSSSSASKDFVSLLQFSTTQIQSSNENTSNAQDDNGITSINVGLGIGISALFIILIIVLLLIRQLKKSRKAESKFAAVNHEASAPVYESLQRNATALQSPVYQELSITSKDVARNSETYEYVN